MGWAASKDAALAGSSKWLLGKFVERICRIAETHQDRGHARGLGRAEVHVAVSDHDGARRHTIGERDHLGQVAPVGFDTVKVSRPATLWKLC